MREVTGIVSRIMDNPSKYGNGRLYTTLLVDDEGNEHGVYYNFGTTKPPFDVGDRVKLGVEFKNAKRAQFVEGQGEIVQRGAGVPSRPNGADRGPTGGGSPRGGGRSGGGWDDPKRQQSIAYQSSRKDALHLIEIALQHEALPLGGGSKGAKFDAMCKILRKVTAELYQDLQDIDGAIKAADVQPPAPPADPGDLPDTDEQGGNSEEIDFGDVDVETPRPRHPAADADRF